MATSTTSLKPSSFMAFFSFSGVICGPNCPTKAGRHDGNDPVSPFDGVDQLEDLPLVGNGAEGAVDNAHPAGDAFVIVDFCPPQLVGADGVHPAGLGAGPFHFENGPVRADVLAAAALDAFGSGR